jgi:hypothetical protein
MSSQLRLACLFAVAVAVQAAGVSPVVVRDRMFVDALGRQRFFRGVNVVYKVRAYVRACVSACVSACVRA